MIPVANVSTIDYVALVAVRNSPVACSAVGPSRHGTQHFFFGGGGGGGGPLEMGGCFIQVILHRISTTVTRVIIKRRLPYQLPL